MTLDVSKLSGWLNADASCRESKGGHIYGARAGRVVCGSGGGRWMAEKATARCKQHADKGMTADLGQGTRGAHPEHGVHVCDAGRVEAQRLVERRRVLWRVERRAHTVRVRGVVCGRCPGRHGGREVAEGDGAV
eukprot:scaffold62657_cov64-Phaeocystis_antarctica.AAC.2